MMLHDDDPIPILGNYKIMKIGTCTSMRTGMIYSYIRARKIGIGISAISNNKLSRACNSTCK